MQQDDPKPITKPEEVAKNPDPNIDKDFPGFPGAQATEELIKPETEEEKATAKVDDENKPAP